MNWKQVKPEELHENAWKLVGSDWMLITAGSTDHFNMMTASWGGFGVLWNRPVVWCVIRPQRYTFEFMEKTDVFSVSFFGEQYRQALEICGSVSGRDVDKVAKAKITPCAGKTPGVTVFTEARIVMECKKLYTQDIDPARFVEPEIDQNYPNKDYHRMYIGEIVYCGIKE